MTAANDRVYSNQKNDISEPRSTSRVAAANVLPMAPETLVFALQAP